MILQTLADIGIENNFISCANIITDSAIEQYKSFKYLSNIQNGRDSAATLSKKEDQERIIFGMIVLAIKNKLLSTKSKTEMDELELINKEFKVVMKTLSTL
jgi:uncharacterized linocin/CFP29 family protein